MSIFNINIQNIFQHYKQKFNVEHFYKITYGEVRTDYSLINNMLNILPNQFFKNTQLKWFDPCCGNGYFMIVVPNFHSLATKMIRNISPTFAWKHTLYFSQTSLNFLAKKF